MSKTEIDIHFVRGTSVNLVRSNNEAQDIKFMYENNKTFFYTADNKTVVCRSEHVVFMTFREINCG